MIQYVGELVAYIKECVSSHGAQPRTPVFVRLGADGPLYAIGQVKMMRDTHGSAIILEASSIIGVKVDG